MSDALASVGVIIGGSLIILFEWTIIDALITLLIASYVLYHGAMEIGGAIRILMSGSLKDGDFEEAIKVILDLPGVRSVHHVHLWAMDERSQSLEAHIVVDTQDMRETEMIKQQIKESLRNQLDVRHSTLEMEHADAMSDCCERDRLGPH